MISKELFINILKRQRATELYCDALLKLNIDLLESAMFDAYGFYLDSLFDAYFTEEGVDTINWFIYEHHSMTEDFDDNLNMLEEGQLHMRDEDGNDITINTIDELWDYIKEFRK